MRSDGKAEIQHYVPQVLLRLHAEAPSAKSRQVWCFDKQTDKIFQANIKGVMASSRFYEVEVDGQTLSLEEPLSEIESLVGPLLARLVRDRTLATLAKEDYSTIASFCAVQLLRTQGFRDSVKDLNRGIAEALRKRGIEPSEISNFKTLSDEEIKTFSMDMLADAPSVYGPHFLRKFWHLIGTTRDDPFHIGDHPITIDHNDLQDGSRGVGLASPGATVYLPLGPTLCLAMTDSAVVEHLFERAREVRRRHEDLEKRAIPEARAQQGFLRFLRGIRDSVNSQIEPMEAGTPSLHNPQVVMRVNSLQMVHAGRWIVSSRPDFSLPKEMIADDPSLRGRRKLEVE